VSEKLELDQPAKQMFVRKRNGSLEPVDLNKILRAVTRCAEGISGVDPSRVAVKTISGLYDGATTQELDQLSIKTAASLIREDANYSKLAASLLSEYIHKEVRLQDIHSFSQSITKLWEMGVVEDRVYEFVQTHARKLNNAVKPENDLLFEYYGLETVVNRWVCRDIGLDGGEGKALETPQYFFMRVAVAKSKNVTSAIALYRSLASLSASLDPSWVDAGLKLLKTNPHIEIPYRRLAAGMGQAVAERTILRKKETGEWETWGDVADRVAFGNASLMDSPNYPSESEYQILRKHLANANTLMSGRHLQHGDADQKSRNMEVFTNCGHVDTKFLTVEYGVTTLGQHVGDVVTVRCADGLWRPAEVKMYGEQMLCSLKFRKVGSGPALYRTERFTRNHRWLLSDGSVTDNINIGDELLPLPEPTEIDPRAVVHGLIFGDGSAHKQRRDNHPTWVSQGRTYADIRVCKQDAVRDEIHSVLSAAGYRAGIRWHDGSHCS
jgi:ATP cone domain